MVNSPPITSKRSSRSLFPLIFNNNSGSAPTIGSSAASGNSQKSSSSQNDSNLSIVPSFDVSKYSVQFTEVMEVEASRNHFFDYLTNIALCNETVNFLRDFDEYKHTYFSRFGNRLLPNNIQNVSTPRNSTGSPQYGRRKTPIQNSEKVHSMNFLSDIFSGVNSVTEPFLSAIKICYTLSSMIMEKYMVNEGLNIPNSVIQKVKNNWEILQNVYEANQWPEEAYHFVTLVELLSPESLFSSVYLAVLTDMKLDQFPRYARSDFLKNFLLKNGEEFTRAIALDNTVGRDCRFKTEDFTGKVLSDHHIMNSFALIEDSPYWNCVYEKESPFPSARYLSSTNFMIGKNLKGLKCIKYIHKLPFPRDYVLAMYASSKEVRKKLDPWIMDFKCTGYHGCSMNLPPFSPLRNQHTSKGDENSNIFSKTASSRTELGPVTNSTVQPQDEEPKSILRNSKSSPCLSSSPRANYKEPRIAFSTVDVPCTIGLGFSQRVFHFVCSLLYDKDLDCFIMYHKTYDPSTDSTSELPNNNIPPTGKEQINADGLTIHYFYKLSDTSTRLVSLVYADLHLPFQNDFYFKLITKTRGKELREALHKQLPAYEKEWKVHCANNPQQVGNGTQPIEADAFVDSLFRVDGKDDFDLYKSLRENLKSFPNRSWYSSYLKSNRK